VRLGERRTAQLVIRQAVDVPRDCPSSLAWKLAHSRTQDTRLKYLIHPFKRLGTVLKSTVMKLRRNDFTRTREYDDNDDDEINTMLCSIYFSWSILYFCGIKRFLYFCEKTTLCY